MINPYQNYLENQVNTSTPDKLLLLLFDGTVRFCQKAEEAIKENDISEAHNNLLRAQDIVLELMSTLDRNYPIAENLLSLYDYIYRRLVEANAKKSLDPINEVVGYLRELRETFAQAALLAKGGSTQGPVRGGIDIEK